MRWGLVLGVPLLLIFSLVGLGGHLLERSHRQYVLARGQGAKARVRSPAGLQWVTVEWQDADGRARIGTAWTGKPFARQLKSNAAGIGAVDIKYIDSSAEVVVLPEVAERERVNDWWIAADIGLGGAMSVLLVWGVLVSLWFRPARPARTRAQPS